MSKLTYAEVIANQIETQSAGGYTTSSDELSIRTGRPQRNSPPPEKIKEIVSLVDFVIVLVSFVFDFCDDTKLDGRMV